VHGRQFPNQQDYWDGNWLRVTAHCGASGASVFSTGPIIHLSELEWWCDQLETLSSTLSGEANLVCIEPAIGVSIKSASLGHITMEVSITPEHLDQRHWFQFGLDQSYLDPFIKQLKVILFDYPLRGNRDQPTKQIFTGSS
jgi:hypothetical protein